MQDQEKIWDVLAEQWYHFRHWPFRDVAEEIKELTLLKRTETEVSGAPKTEGFHAKGKILEIGCGNCRNLLPFAKAGFDCYGIDFSKGMLKVAQDYMRKHNFEVKLEKAQAEKLHFRANTFDYILSIATLHHLNKKEQQKAVEEMHRVLKSRGIALIAVWNKFPLSLFVKQKYQTWTKAGKTHYRYYYYFTFWELKKLFLRNGFEILRSKVGKNIILVVRKIL